MKKLSQLSSGLGPPSQDLILIQGHQDAVLSPGQGHCGASVRHLWDLACTWLCAQCWNCSSGPSSEHLSGCQKVLQLAHATSLPKAALEKGQGAPVALGQKGGPTVRDGGLMRSDGSPWALASHLGCDLIQEKRGGESTFLTEHHLLYVSFSFTSYVQSVCCPTLLSRLSLGSPRLLTVFTFCVSPRAFLYALRAFSVFIIYGGLSFPLSFSHPPHTQIL